MASVVDICNLALGWLAVKPITSEELNSQSSVQAKLCHINYPLLRDAVLEARAWTFATRRTFIAPLTNQDEQNLFGYLNRFELPDKCLRVLRAGSTPDFHDRLRWTKEEHAILANTGKLFIQYIHQEKDTGKFSAAFVQALATRLAADLAIPLTEDAKIQETMFRLYINKITEAAATDGTQGRQEKIRSDTLIRVRYDSMVGPFVGPVV
jgi:hypothetical protein